MEELRSPGETRRTCYPDRPQRRELGQELPSIWKAPVPALVHATPEERFTTEIDNENGIDAFCRQLFRVVMRIDVGNVGTLHKFVGVIGHREFAS